MKGFRTFASPASESVAALEPYMQLFNQQHLELNQQHLVQSVERLEKNSAAAFDRLSEKLAKITDN